MNYFLNEHKRNAIRKKAYLHGRAMVWKEVAERYLRLVGEVFEQRPTYPAPLN